MRAGGYAQVPWFFSETGITPTGKHPFGYFIILRPKIIARFTFILSWLKSTTITCTLGPHTIQQTQDTAPTWDLITSRRKRIKSGYKNHAAHLTLVRKEIGTKANKRKDWNPAPAHQGVWGVQVIMYCPICRRISEPSTIIVVVFMMTITITIIYWH